MTYIFYNEEEIEAICNYLIEMSNANQDEDFIYEMIGMNSTRENVFSNFKNTVMIWSVNLKYVLINGDNFELAQKIKQVIEMEKKDAIINLQVINQAEELDSERFDLLIHEINSIIGI